VNTRTIHCQYHAAVPARWRCEKCLINLCAPCGARSSPPRCISCESELESLGLGNAIKPFWERVPRMFLYPLQFDVMAVILGLSVLGLLAQVPIVGIGVAIVTSIATFRLSYQVLYHTALGNLDAPQRARAEFRNVFWQQLVIFIILFFAVGLVAGVTKSPQAGVVVLLLAVPLIPASVITLALQQSIGAAINPLRLAQTAFTIGPSYLLLCLLLLLLFGGEAQLLALVVPRVPAWMALFFANFASVYFFVVMFHLMGYVVYQYHEELGFEVTQDFTQSQEAAQDYARQATAAPSRIEVLVTEGRIAEALAETEAQLKDDRDNLALNDRYHRLLLAQEQDAEVGADHADFYIGKLIAAGRVQQAFEVYRRSVERWSAVPVKDAGDAVALARKAWECGHGKLGLPLLARFAQRFPGHAVIPEAQLLVAQLLFDSGGRADLAVQVLEQLKRAYPAHPLRPRMDQLTASIERSQARRTAAPAQTAK
jgi:tetratricopeptide (TPR) repeat protein